MLDGFATDIFCRWQLVHTHFTGQDVNLLFTNNLIVLFLGPMSYIYIHMCVCVYMCIYIFFLVLILFSFLTSLLEYNCFAMVCYFLLYNKVNQLYVYIYLHIPPSCVSLPPSLYHPSRWSQSTELISLCYAAASH